MRLLLLNAFKGLKHKKIQMFGIIFLVLLSTAIYTGMNSAIDRLEDKYYSYLDEQNVEHITVSVNIDLQKGLTEKDIDNILNTSMKDASNEDKMFMQQYKKYLKNPIFDVNMIYGAQTIFNKYNALEKKQIEILDNLKDKYDFTYEKEYSKTVQNGKHLLKVLPYNKDKKINKVYLVEGKLPVHKNEITMLKATAKKNKIKIGDYYKINNKKYKVVGFTYAPDYVYPLVSLSMPIYDEKNNNIIFINSENYDELLGINENSYSIVYNFKPSRRYKVDTNAEMKDGKMVFKDPIIGYTK